MSLVPRDVVLLPESTPDRPDRWVAMNVLARTCLGISSEVVRVMGNLNDARDAGPFRCWHLERFSNEDGLLADPSRFERDLSAWHEVMWDRRELLTALKAKFIVVDDVSAYRSRFASKRNVLDVEHFGNFHEQHGQHMLLAKRTSPSEWWMRQKFTPDRRSVRHDTLYGAIQAAFLEQYFAKHFRPGLSVIDLGCGTGTYANLAARFGAEVLGIDPSDQYLGVARANAAPGTRFARMDIGTAGALDAVAGQSADVVFMCDALLFYFVPVKPGPQPDIQVLLSDIRRILKPGGTFISVEPHSTFYLTPWLGELDRPFTIVSEYLNKSYGVTPPFSSLIGALTKAGFVVEALHELRPAAGFEGVDPRGYQFSQEFPLWQVMELRPAR